MRILEESFYAALYKDLRFRYSTLFNLNFIVWGQIFVRIDVRLRMTISHLFEAAQIHLTRVHHIAQILRIELKSIPDISYPSLSGPSHSSPAHSSDPLHIYKAALVLY